MNFIERLPKLEENDTIMVIVDRFTKFAHFIAMSHPFTTQDVAQLFMEHLYKLHGLPITILTDMDKTFTSFY